MSFRAKREILKWYYAEKRRFLPAVEMTDSLRGSFYERIILGNRDVGQATPPAKALHGGRPYEAIHL